MCSVAIPEWSKKESDGFRDEILRFEKMHTTRVFKAKEANEPMFYVELSKLYIKFVLP